MRNVAREMNLSETAFLLPRDGEFDLRWLTPAVEVDLCGHATVASAHVLWEDGHLPPVNRRVSTRAAACSSRPPRRLDRNGFPGEDRYGRRTAGGIAARAGRSSALAVAKNPFDYLVEVESEEELRALKPDHSTLRKMPVRGIIVTARSSTTGFDFISRFFAPGSGIDEDPVTGSAHTALGPYWGSKLGKAEMTGFQASARGGVVRVRLNGDRIILGGQAVTVMEATLLA